MLHRASRLHAPIVGRLIEIRPQIITQQKQVRNLGMPRLTHMHLMRSTTGNILAEVESPGRSRDLCIKTLTTDGIAEMLHCGAEYVDVRRRVYDHENVDDRLRSKPCNRCTPNVMNRMRAVEENRVQPARFHTELRRPLRSMWHNFDDTHYRWCLMANEN